MDVSILIVNWNGARLLPDCLDSIPAGAEGLRYEVIIVDNASTDEGVPWLMAVHPEVELIRNPQNLGFARANNQALAIARGRYALLLNNDARLASGTLTHLVDWMDKARMVGAVSPRLVMPDGKPQPYAFGKDPTPFYLLRRGLWCWIVRSTIGGWRSLRRWIGSPARACWCVATCGRKSGCWTRLFSCILRITIGACACVALVGRCGTTRASRRCIWAGRA